MADRSLDRARHVATIAEGKDHLGAVPGHLRAGLARYLELGMQPSQFLCAVLDNDLHQAVARAANVLELPAVCSWLYNFAPAACWGSKEKRLAWQERVAALVPQPEEVEIVAPVDGVDGIVTFVGEVFLGTANEPHDTERPPAEAEELAAQ